MGIQNCRAIITRQVRLSQSNMHKTNVGMTYLLMIGDKGIRTPGLTGAIRALYQLSYIPTFFITSRVSSVKIITQTS